MLFIILTDNFPNALKFLFCILLMQIEHFSLIEQIHSNQHAYDVILKKSLVLKRLHALLYGTLPVDGNGELVTT